MDPGRNSLYADVALRLATVSSTNLDVSIETILQMIAVEEGADRAYVIEFRDFGTQELPELLIGCTHEWCEPGIDAQIGYVQNLSPADFPWSFGLLSEHKVVQMSDLSDAPPEAGPERKSFERYGVRSMLQVPMMMDGEVTGLVGFNSVRQHVIWPETTIQQLRGVCDALGTALTRKRAHEAIEEARQAAEASNLAKSRFLSRMSHELRTPLNAVLGFTELLLTSEGRSDEDREALEMVFASGEHLLALVEDVLDISRVESGGLSVSLTEVGVCEAVAEAAKMIEVSGVSGEVQLAITEEGKELAVIADGRRLQQVLVNLLSNGCKYNSVGGSVEVSWCVASSGEEVDILVRDTGPGISPDALERIFEPFDRLGHEHSDIEGTGIGLTLTKMLVELMGGTIWVDSVQAGSATELRPEGVPGSGTVVTVRLGRAPDLM